MHLPTLKRPLLLAACLLTIGTALAQTAVPANVPGALPVAPPDASSAGGPRAHRRTGQVPGMTHRDKKRLRTLTKVPANPDGSMRMPPK
ncbi:hypothetical protein GCM10023172_07370 [Hymenobacter ginsengisoli]|uniref:Uncharacterized protein n=1 Tax=Hymenobacter ginsengisoli TaxID=1051626 RepID=A0ABP8PZ84_9BACT|nr:MULTISPECIES: hypothetical protein [unclassified Hymenobacter]MBO2032614.1 hypothetical protein [Hymenobacter sp. BT559]